MIHKAKKSLGLKKFSNKNFSPEHVKALGLKPDYGFVRAKKALGQNFLKSEPALRKIIEAGEINSNDIILEIGPGKGVLTKKLLSAQSASHNEADKEKAGCVIAVEKDKNLVGFLKEKFAEEIKIGKLILLEGDILDFDVSYIGNTFSNGLGERKRAAEDLRKRITDGANPASEKILSDSPRKSSAENFLCPSPSLLPRVPSRVFSPSLNYKIIANIPYNITGAILKKFLTEKNQPAMMVVMVQNEVAKRIMGRGGNPSTPHRVKESILSISVKAYGTPKMEMKVPARYFSPAPKVDSAVISIKNISRKNFTLPETPSPLRQAQGHSPLAGGEEFEKRFWEIIHAGFAHKRKKLASNLKKSLKLDEKTQKNYEKILGNKRAEDLILADWLLLTKMG